jgi:hypothetical protein
VGQSEHHRTSFGRLIDNGINLGMQTGVVARERRALTIVESGEGRAVMIQGSPGPVIRGVEPDGFDYVCGRCDQVIVENTIVGELWDVTFRCFACGAMNACPELPPGMPLPIPSVMVPPGNYMIGGTVDGKAGVVMVGEAAIQRRSKETGWMAPAAPARALDTPDSLRSLLDQAKVLVGSALFHDLETSDRLSQGAKETPAKERHRLMEISEAVQIAAASFTIGRPMMDPVAIVELQLLIEVLRRWQYDPAWPGIVASLQGDFHHALMTLAAAGFLMDAGNGVGLHVEQVPGRRGADLRIAAGSRQRLSIEVKTPKGLRNPQSPLTEETATRFLRKALKKAGTGAGGQLSSQYPSVLALGGFHLRDADLNLLERLAPAVIAERAEKREHLAAITIISVGALLSTPPATPQTELTATISTRFARNPGYTGSVRFEVGERPGVNRLRALETPVVEVTVPGSRQPER